LAAEPFDVPQIIAPPRRKFQHRYWVHLAWFLLTLITTTLAVWWPARRAARLDPATALRDA